MAGWVIRFLGPVGPSGPSRVRRPQPSLGPTPPATACAADARAFRDGIAGRDVRGDCGKRLQSWARSLENSETFQGWAIKVGNVPWFPF